MTNIILLSYALAFAGIITFALSCIVKDLTRGWKQIILLGITAITFIFFYNCKPIKKMAKNSGKKIEKTWESITSNEDEISEDESDAEENDQKEKGENTPPKTDTATAITPKPSEFFVLVLSKADGRNDRYNIERSGRFTWLCAPNPTDQKMLMDSLKINGFVCVTADTMGSGLNTNTATIINVIAVPSELEEAVVKLKQAKADLDSEDDATYEATEDKPQRRKFASNDQPEKKVEKKVKSKVQQEWEEKREALRKSRGNQ